MNEETIAIKKWIDGWEKTQVKLNSIKSEEMRKEDYLFNSLNSLTDIFNFSLIHSIPSQTSGLVEMQKYFSNLPRP